VKTTMKLTHYLARGVFLPILAGNSMSVPLPPA
jgi:hypothetical protein